MIRIGIVGTGNIVGISHFHTVSLLKDGRAEITAVYDTRKEGAAQWVSEHGLSAVVCDSYEQLLDMVDAVNICVPNRFHYEYAVKAIQANKHFFVEKPMALTIEQCNNLKELCKTYDKINMVGFVYRFSNAVQEAKKIVSNQIGPVYTLSSWFGGKRIANPDVPKEWRMTRSLSGSGALGDFGSHMVDIADFVAGQKYHEIQCQTDISIKKRAGQSGQLEDVENDDCAVFTGKSNNGLGCFTASRVGMDDMMVLLAGQGGMLQLSLRGEGNLTYWEKNPSGSYTGKMTEILFEKQKPFDGWFDSQMTAYLDWIEGKKGFCADTAQGYYVENVLHQAELSSFEKNAKEIIF